MVAKHRLPTRNHNVHAARMHKTPVKLSIEIRGKNGIQPNHGERNQIRANTVRRHRTKNHMDGTRPQAPATSALPPPRKRHRRHRNAHLHLGITTRSGHPRTPTTMRLENIWKVPNKNLDHDYMGILIGDTTPTAHPEHMDPFPTTTERLLPNDPRERNLQQRNCYTKEDQPMPPIP